MPLMKMVHDVDPALAITQRVGDLSGVEVFGNGVLVGVYIRPKKTSGGIHLPDQVQQEDEYQGKAGLVLKLGADAFRSDQSRDFNGLSVNIGDWIIFKTSDGWPLKINSNDGLCRIIDDIDIRGRIAAPDQVW